MFRTDSSGDVFEQLIDGQWQPFNPERFGWATPRHRLGADLRRSVDQLSALPGFVVTESPGDQLVPGPRPSRSILWGKWTNGEAPPAAAQSRAGNRGTLSYMDRLSDAFGLVASWLPIKPERSPFVVNDFVNGRVFEISFTPAPLSPSGDGVVYLLDDGDAFKIGHTRSHVAARISGLQTGNPRVIRAVATIGPANESVESELHTRLGQWALRGEWFKRDGILAEVVRVGSWEQFLRETLDGANWDIHIYAPYI